MAGKKNNQNVGKDQSPQYNEIVVKSEKGKRMVPDLDLNSKSE